jgi:serine/threonine protein kinase
MAQPAPEAQYGQTAAGLGFISQAQVQECLTIQVKMREMGIDEPLGEILVKKRYLTPQQHQAVLKKLGVVTQPIPGYTLHAKIGQGGMGTVYKATQTSVNRLVAIKVLAPQFTKDRMFVARFFQEARAAGKLNHQNLISAIDVGEASGLFYFVMEFIVGRSCRDILNKEGPFPEARVQAVALQMAAALEYIHQHGMVHRDIKPENILLADDGTVKLCDLGLAKSTSAEEQSLTQTGLAVGTPHFMSPEQCRGDKDVDIRADLYGLGASLYFLVTGGHPYEGKSALETMNLHISAPVPDPRKAAPALGDGFARVIQKLMAKDRKDRYPTPTELLEDLRKIQSGAAPVHARPPAPRPIAKVPSTARIQIVRPKPRWPWLAAAAGGIALAAGLAAMMSSGRDVPRPDPVAIRPPERPTEPSPTAAKTDPAPPRDPSPAALARARVASAKDPSDLATLVPLFEKALEETRGTPFFDETRRVLEGLYRRELEPVEAQATEAAKREEFGAALALLEQARPRHATEGWVQAVDARAASLRSETSRLFDWLRSTAVEARRRGSEDEVRALTDRIAKWGFAEMQKSLEHDLAAAGPARTAAVPADGYARRWETAVAMASARDAAAAIAAIEGSTHADAAPDLELLRAAGAVLAEAIQALSKITRSTKLALRYTDESGAFQRIEEPVFRADPFRIEFRHDEGAVIVTLGEITADSLAEAWKARSPRKAWKDGRAAALLCILDGDVAAARRHLGSDPDLPAKYWALGARLEEERAKPRPREDDARRRFVAAEREFADPATQADAVRGFTSLLKDSADTSFVRRNRAAISPRLDGAREFFFVADDLKGSGTFRASAPAKGPACWMSETDSEPAKRAENSIEITFSVLPDTEYRAWAYVGGCCMETLGFHLQAVDAADPSGAAPQLVKHSLSVTKTHASHGGTKQPSRWGWVSLPLPKYASSGTRRVRLLTDQKGFSVAYAFVSSVKTAPPRDAEVKEIEKSRGEPRAAAVEPGLVGWWKFDERSGATAADSTKYKNHGTLKNGPAWIAGKAGGALSFNGVDSHVRIPDSPSINSIGAQMSVACWVQRLADQPEYRLCVSRQLGTGDENQFWLGFEDNEMGFSITTSKGMLEITGKKAPNNEWIHLAGTYDGTTARLYVNGVEATSSAHGGPLAASTRSLMIGADEFDDKGSVQEVPKAVIDDVRLYNRALTTAEVAALAGPRPR